MSGAHRKLIRTTALGLTKSLKPYFEGPVKIRWFKDAVEGTGKCRNCGSELQQLLRVNDPAMQKEMDTLEGRQIVREQLFDKIQENHQCTMVHDGKTDIEDWLKRL